MKHAVRAFAAVAAAATLTFAGIHTADAKPAHAGGHAKAAASGKAAGKSAATGQAQRAVDRVKAQLDRAVSDHRLSALDLTVADALRANVAADKAALDALAATGAADVRKALRSYRVENYVHAVNLLRHAATVQAAAAAAGNAEAGALADQAVAAALTITATSAKADVKAVRATLAQAQQLLEEAAAPADGSVPEGGTTDGGNATA